MTFMLWKNAEKLQITRNWVIFGAYINSGYQARTWIQG